MFSSTVLEVAIGLVFCYASVTLIASGIYEAAASVFRLRASTLLAGVKELLNDKSFTGLAKDVYNHALVNPLSDGKATAGTRPDVTPSYIDPQHFALALIDSVERLSGSRASIKDGIDKIQDPQIKQLLEGIYVRAASNTDRLQADLAAWFDAGMQRLSGGYKRQAQLATFILALAIAALLNIDSIQLPVALWDHPALMAQISAPDVHFAGQALQKLGMLPIGWDHAPQSVLLAACGWLLTATSALFGAPFWFDLLQRFVSVRGTGKKPDGASK